MEIVAGLLRHPSPISIDASEACETFPYVFKSDEAVSEDSESMISTFLAPKLLQRPHPPLPSAFVREWLVTSWFPGDLGH